MSILDSSVFTYDPLIRGSIDYFLFGTTLLLLLQPHFPVAFSSNRSRPSSHLLTNQFLLFLSESTDSSDIGTMASSNTNIYILDLDEMSAGLKAACTVNEPKNETPCATHSQDGMKQLNLVNSPEVSIKASSVSTPVVYDRWTLLDPSSINYGPFSTSSALPCPSLVRSGDDEQEKQETFYITTAINYTNGPAHMGVSVIVLDR